MMKQCVLADLWVNSKKKSILWAVLNYYISPGFGAAVAHRIAARLYGGNPLAKALSKMFWLRNTRRGVYISPISEIGAGLRLPHPVAIVVGDGARIGRDVTLYQGVTLGRRRDNLPEYPTIGDGVTIYANSTILGAVHIGAGAVVGAHSVVTSDVEANTLVAGVPARKIRSLL